MHSQPFVPLMASVRWSSLMISKQIPKKSILGLVQPPTFPHGAKNTSFYKVEWVADIFSLQLLTSSPCR